MCGTTVDGRVAAVVMTYNRCQRLRRWLRCIEQQTRAVDEIIVIDNGSSDGTQAMVREDFPGVTLVELGENLGPSAAAARGLRCAYERGFDWIWIFDDDAFPQPEALTTALGVVASVDDNMLGMAWLPFSDFGGWQWQGRKIPVSLREKSDNGRAPFRIDMVDLNMTLIPRSLIEAIGYPREDFFIMMWSSEYCLRIADAGFSIWVAPEVLVRHEHAGSTGCGVWRTYYQTRNQLVMALKRRSVSLLWWWNVRQIRLVAGEMLRHPQKWTRLKLRMLGCWDAIRGCMGKRIDPADFHQRSAADDATQDVEAVAAR